MAKKTAQSGATAETPSQQIPAAWRIWLGATRPRTLPAAIAPVLVGTTLAWSEAQADVWAAGLCLAFALLAQIAANFANDYFDFVKGADTRERVGPRRAVAAGLVKPETMKRATLGVCVAAFATGLCLLHWGGWPLLVVGVTSLLCAVGYTGGPFPLAYKGLGDVFVFIFFGLVAVCCTYYVQTGHLDSSATLLCAIAIGALATNILIANNYRDAETDAKAGKRTTIVLFGRGFGKALFVTSHLVALTMPVLLWLIEDYDPEWGSWLLFAPLLYWSYRLCRGLRPERQPKDLIRILAGSGLYLFFYALLLSAWLMDAAR